jgi:PAS domain S-box-containing protein
MGEQKYKFEDLVDISSFGAILDNLYQITDIPSAIIDINGKVLTKAGWQRICFDFHRKNSASEELCIKSDTFISAEIDAGKPYVIYECPHGLIDSSCPIILDGEHIANVFIGQVLHEPLKYKSVDRFRKQAQLYGFDETDYLAALSEVPVLDIEKHKKIIELISQLAQQISQVALANLKIIEQNSIIKEREERCLMAQEVAGCGSWDWDIVNNKTTWSSSTFKQFGFSPDEITPTYEIFASLVSPTDIDKVNRAIKKALKGGTSYSVDAQMLRKDGTPWVMHSRGAVKRDNTGRATRFIGIQQDITTQKSSKIELQRLNEELEVRIEERTNELQKKNIALTEILNRFETEKQNVAGMVDINVHKLLLPTLNKLIEKSSSFDRRYLVLIKQNLEELTNSFGSKLTSLKYQLTPKETDLCILIKGGFSIKEISTMQNLSVRTVESHRLNIRRKLGITSKKINLATYLTQLKD